MFHKGSFGTLSRWTSGGLHLQHPLLLDPSFAIQEIIDSSFTDK